MAFNVPQGYSSFDLYSIRGDTIRLDFQFVSGENLPINITGSDILLDVRKCVNDSSYALRLGIGSGITLTNAPSGQFNAKFTSSQTSLLSGSYLWDAQITLPNDDRYTLCGGNLIFDLDITHD